MIIQKFSSVGLDVKLNVPSSVEEFQKLGGDPLAEAINNIVYRGPLAEFREALCAKLEELTKVERKTKEVPAKKAGEAATIEWDESEARYVSRVQATLGLTPEAFSAQFQPEADAIASAIVFDPKQKERKSAAPKALAKKYLEAADDVIAKGGAEKVAAKLTKRLGSTVTPDRDGLARGIKMDFEAKLAAMSADLLK